MAMAMAMAVSENSHLKNRISSPKFANPSLSFRRRHAMKSGKDNNLFVNGKY